MYYLTFYLWISSSSFFLFLFFSYLYWKDNISKQISFSCKKIWIILSWPDLRKDHIRVIGFTIHLGRRSIFLPEFNWIEPKHYDMSCFSSLDKVLWTSKFWNMAETQTLRVLSQIFLLWPYNKYTYAREDHVKNYKLGLGKKQI